MKVLLIGDSGVNPDEGMQNISRHITKSLQDDGRVSVRLLPAQAIPRRLSSLWSWRPDIIHFLHGPSVKAVLLAYALKAALRSRVIVSLTHPALGRIGWTILRRCRPDAVLASSAALVETCRRYGISSRIMPLSGVNPERFRPVSPIRRAELRAKLGFGQNEIVLLHVGHLKRRRNLQVTAELARHERVRAVVIGSTATAVEEDMITELREAGCAVLHGFVPDIEQYYQAADLYVFPVRHADEAVTVPLSVLEAMATGLPVLSTNFGGLPDLFPACEGLVYAEPDEFARFMTASSGGAPRLRRMALPHSWEVLAARLVDLYHRSCGKVLAGREQSAIV